MLFGLLFGDSLLLGVLIGTRIFLEQLLRGHRERRIALQTLIQVGVIDRFGMELLLDPFFQAHLANSFDIARTRAVREAIHGVQDGFVFGELGDRELAFEFLVEGDVFGERRVGMLEALDWASFAARACGTAMMRR